MTDNYTLARIEGMRRFLVSCKITGYMLDDQIELLEMALDALAEKINCIPTGVKE